MRPHNYEWRDMLQELLDNEDDVMTAWEVEFIESMDKLRARNGDPSEKQQACLERIWSKVYA
jgi:hypothetical protein